MKNELYHYGIKGMKWGVRRYQNEDGSLTPKGRERYRDTKTGRAGDYIDPEGYMHLAKIDDWNEIIDDLPQIAIERGREFVQNMPLFDMRIVELELQAQEKK